MDAGTIAAINMLRDELMLTKRVVVILFMAINQQPISAAKQAELKNWIEHTGATTMPLPLSRP